jgi:hypothetical protein
VAVVSIRKLWADRVGEEDEKAKRTYTRGIGVTTDNTLTGIISVKVAVTGFIGGRFTPYVDDDGLADPLGAYAERISVRQVDDDPNEWLAVVYYSSRSPNPQQNTESPTQRTPTVKWDFVQWQRPIERDAEGFAMVNSAGEKFDPPIEIDDSRLQLTITRYETSYSPALALSYKDVVNSDVFAGCQPGQVKAKPFTSDQQFENGVYYFAVTYVFDFRQTWKLHIIDQGYHTMDPTTGALVVINDKNFQPVSAPALLNGDGGLLNGTGTITPCTTLAALCDNQQQFINVTTGTALPGLGVLMPNYHIMVDSEIMLVTGAMGTANPSVLRGQRQTAAVQHAAGANVTQLEFYIEFTPYASKKFALLGLEAPPPPGQPIQT